MEAVAAGKEDIAALQEARAQKALKTVEPLTLRADTPGGPSPATGAISPAALRGAVNRSYSNAAVAQTGDIPLNDLARVGQRFLKEPPDSGTATREMVNHGLGLLGAAGGALALGHEFGLPMAQALLSGAGAAGAARLAGSYLRSDFYTNNLLRAAQDPGAFRFELPNYLARLLLAEPPSRRRRSRLSAPPFLADDRLSDA